MTDPILDLIEATATDPAADQTLKDWILESVVPVLCAEVRQIRKESRPFERPCRPVSWRDWQEQRERERAAQQPPVPPPTPVVDDWYNRPLGPQKTNGPALERRA